MLTTKLRGSLTILMVLFILPAVGSPQRVPGEKDRQHNFYEIQKRYNERFAAQRRDRRRPPREGEFDDEETRFRRFEVFWGPRVDAKGGFNTYYEELDAFEKWDALSFELACDTCRRACQKSFWTQLGPQSLPTQNMGAILSLWVNPNDPNEILAGTYSAGLYRTYNHGASWERITTLGCKGECSEFPQGGISSIAVNPQNKDVIYITVGLNRGQTEAYSLGVYKTMNGGVTWCPTDLKFDPKEYVAASKVVIDPNDPNTLYATGGNRVFKTKDGGATWKTTVVYAALNDHEIVDIAVSRNTANAGLYISETGERCQDAKNNCPNGKWGCPLADGKIWYDPNFGDLPSQRTDITNTALGIPVVTTADVKVEKALFSVTPNSVSILALSDAHPSTVCPVAVNADRIIARNSNNDPTLPFFWTQHVNLPATAWAADSHGAGFPTAFAVSPVNDQLVLIGSDHGNSGLDDLFISDTGGGQPTANLNQDCLHADLRTLAFAGSTIKGVETWIVGNDGGVSEATVRAGLPTGPCKNLNGFGLTATDFFGISGSEIDPSKIYGGAQDNGALSTNQNGWQWYHVGDGYDTVTDVTNPDKAYVVAIGKSIYYTTDGGINWGATPFSDPGEERIPNMPMVIDKSNALYLAQQNVWRFYPPTAALTKLSQWDIQKEPPLRALHVPALNASTVIAAKNRLTGSNKGANVIFRTDAAHFNAASPVPWVDITYDLPVNWQLVTGIASDEKGENVWASLGNFGNGHVYLLRKGSTKWENYSQGLPDLPAGVIKYWEGSGDDGLFLGTDVGVYYRNRDLAEWKRISCELPNVLITDLDINNRAQKLRAATRGMGVWETGLAALKNQGCTGDAYLAASYTGGSGATNKDLTNNAVVTDAVPNAPVRLTPKRVCCVEPCETVANYTWKVYRLWVYTGATQLVAAGQNSAVIFTPDFGVKNTRGNYRVEVTGVCGVKTCPTLTVQLNRL